MAGAPQTCRGRRSLPTSRGGLGPGAESPRLRDPGPFHSQSLRLCAVPPAGVWKRLFCFGIIVKGFQFGILPYSEACFVGFSSLAFGDLGRLSAL